VQATPVVRRIAQELNVDLAAVAEAAQVGGSPKRTLRSAAGGGDGRREPLRGVAASSRAHGRAPPRGAAVTWVEECDFDDVRSSACSRRRQGCVDSLREFPS
jgi:pyruvate/2-oxoglutarate dehydrogenase complex dihydrolipoamide acyltransferase (E2) component